MFSDELKRKQKIVEDGAEESLPFLRGTADGANNQPLIHKEILCTHYEVVEKLGSGGMGDVLLCRHVTLGQLVAIKVLRVDKATSAISISRFETEAKATFQLNHPNIIRMLDFRVSEDGRPCLIMEYLESTGLDQILAQEGTLDVERVVSMFTQICNGLIYAHSKGIIHRDLKPSNLMVGKRDDGSEEIKIVDFGIAKIVEIDQNNQLTQTGEIFGSPLYMSPEQCTGATPDHRSDLYSVGCAMFECITGEPPFRAANPMQTMFMHVQQSPPVPKFGKPTTPAVTLAMGSILNKLLSKDPNKRFQNASELKAALLDLNTAGSKGNQQKSQQLFVRFAVAATLTLVAIGVSLCVYQYTKTTAASNAPIESSTYSASIDEQARAAGRVQQLYANGIKLELNGELDKALEEYRKAVVETKILQEHDVNTRQALIGYVSLAFRRRLEHPYKDFIPTLVRLEGLLNDPPAELPQDQSNIYGWHGVAEYEAKNYQESLPLFKKAEALVAHLPKNAGLFQKIEWQLWQANYWAHEHDIKAAEQIYDRVEREIGNTDPATLCWLFTVKTGMYESINNKEEARKSAEKARNVAISGKLDRSNAKVLYLNQLLERLGMAQLD